MNCSEVVELMTEYLENALSVEDRRRFEEHLSGCGGCQAYLEQMRATLRLTGRLAAEPVPPELEDELLNAFRDWHSKRERRGV
jgi:anti-sigma factor RsiW